MLIKRADLHLHTRFSQWKHLRFIKPRDCYSEPLEVYRRCKQIGMDFVAITDHDTIDGAMDLLERHPDLEPEIIVGEEVETHFPDTKQWVHVNVFDIDEPIHRDITHLKRDVRELVPYLRSKGLFYVLNHPFQSYRLQKPALSFIDDILELFDHFEVGNGTLPSRHNQAVAEMLDLAAALCLKKHGVGGSDAHHIAGIGRYCTEAEVDAAPVGPAAPSSAPPGSLKRAWLSAVARGKGRAAGRSIGAAGLTANVYRIIGQYYLSLRDPEVRRHMRAKNYLAAAVLAPACIAGLPAFLNLGNTLRLEAVTSHLRRAMRSLATTRPGARDRATFGGSAFPEESPAADPAD